MTLSPVYAERVRQMGEKMGSVGPTEVVKRALHILDLYLSLPDDDELVIRRKSTGDIGIPRFFWGFSENPADSSTRAGRVV